MSEEKELKHWKQEVELIPQMVKIYCHGKHHTKKGELCERCQAINEYALYRLNKCPFKKNKKFCSFCKVHCYTPENRVVIKDIMRYSGPRMMFTHPIFSFSHVFQMIKYKKQMKKQQTANGTNNNA